MTPQIIKDILKINLSFDNTTPDKPIWTRHVNGDLPFKCAYKYIMRDQIESS